MHFQVVHRWFYCAIIVVAASANAIASPPKRDFLTNQLLWNRASLAWISVNDPQPPPVPVWPQIFTIKFYVYVEKYGNDWSSTGILYYDWTSKV